MFKAGHQSKAVSLRTRTWKGYLSSYIMIAPAMIFLLIFVVYPMFNIIQLSMFTGNALKPYKKFVGFFNYNQILFVKTDFIAALVNTAYYTIISLVLTIVLSVILGVWMQRDRKINRFAQTMFFTPHLVASISCAFIWTWLYNKNDYGLFNTVLSWFGLPAQSWLNNSKLAMNSVIAMNVWKSVGYYALIILAALKSIPTEIYEAAKLDSSSPVKTFFKITLPMLSPQLFFLLITITTGSFKVFDSIRIMTGGGPGDSTRVLSMYIYDYAFQRNNTLGIGAAAGVVLMIILILVTLLDFKGLERKVHYQ